MELPDQLSPKPINPRLLDGLLMPDEQRLLVDLDWEPAGSDGRTKRAWWRSTKTDALVLVRNPFAFQTGDTFADRTFDFATPTPARPVMASRVRALGHFFVEPPFPPGELSRLKRSGAPLLDNPVGRGLSMSVFGPMLRILSADEDEDPDQLLANR